MIRLVRLVRVGRLWKQANLRLNKDKNQAEENEFAQALRAQRTINLMKQKKQAEASMRDIAKINRRASILQSSKTVKRNTRNDQQVNIPIIMQNGPQIAAQ